MRLLPRTTLPLLITRGRSYGEILRPCMPTQDMSCGGVNLLSGPEVCARPTASDSSTSGSELLCASSQIRPAHSVDDGDFDSYVNSEAVNIAGDPRSAALVAELAAQIRAVFRPSSAAQTPTQLNQSL